MGTIVLTLNWDFNFGFLAQCAMRDAVKWDEWRARVHDIVEKTTALKKKIDECDVAGSEAISS